MFNYPVFFNLKSHSCLVVGAGEVGRRKAFGLLRAGAGQVVLLAPSPPGKEEDELALFPSFKRVVREFVKQDLKGHLLVFAATDNAELNLKIAKLCEDLPCACNLAGASNAFDGQKDLSSKAPDSLSGNLQGRQAEPALAGAATQGGSFVLPAYATCARTGDKSSVLQIAISSQGQSPALVKRIAADLNALLPQQYGEHLEFMARLRPVILALNLSSQENKHIFSFFAEKKQLNPALTSQKIWNAQTYLPRNEEELALALALVLPAACIEQIEKMTNNFFKG